MRCANNTISLPAEAPKPGNYLGDKRARRSDAASKDLLVVMKGQWHSDDVSRAEDYSDKYKGEKHSTVQYTRPFLEILSISGVMPSSRTCQRSVSSRVQGK